MDVNIFFIRTKRFLIDLLIREMRDRAVHSQATAWIRFVKMELNRSSWCLIAGCWQFTILATWMK